MTNHRGTILSLIGGHLSTAPRPIKEADALTDAGYSVTVAGFWFDDQWVRHDQELLARKQWEFVPLIDFRNKMSSFLPKVKRKVAEEAYKRTAYFSPVMMSLGYHKQLSFARRVKADLTVAHMEAGLWIIEQLYRVGYTTGVDFEDWFSEDLREEDRKERPLRELRVAEKKALNQSSYRLTTSHALAQELATFSDTKLPSVVYNTFPDHKEVPDPGKFRSPGPIKFFWYSQTIGPGRGLEDFWQAAAQVDGDFELHLLGNKFHDFDAWYHKECPDNVKKKIQFHGIRPPEKLSLLMRTFDVGLALETPRILNRDLTVTNKLFEYIQNGLPVLATATRGQCEVLKDADAAWLIDSNDPNALRQSIQSIIDHGGSIREKKTAARELYENHYCWDIQKAKIIEAANQATSSRTATRTDQ